MAQLEKALATGAWWPKSNPGTHPGKGRRREPTFHKVVFSLPWIIKEIPRSDVVRTVSLGVTRNSQNPPVSSPGPVSATMPAFFFNDQWTFRLSSLSSTLPTASSLQPRGHASSMWHTAFCSVLTENSLANLFLKSVHSEMINLVNNWLTHFLLGVG